MWLPPIAVMARSRRVRPARRPSHPLILEGLEDRSLPSFLAPVSYPVGNAPHALAVGDFNKDGTPDLVVANHQIPGTVTVLLGKGDGTFQPAQSYAVGGAPVSVAAGDFNGDGSLDIVTASDNGIVSVLLGKGDGSFQPALNYLLPNQAGLTQSPLSLAVGDFDKDGKLDLAVTAETTYANYYGSTSNGYVNVLIGNGAGGFTTDNVCALGSVAIGSIAAADLNRDGNLDLAVTEGTAVGVLLGNGNGTFKPAQSYAVGGAWGSSVAAGDFNGDGKMDLVTANGNNTISILLGNGDGTFETATNYAVGVATTSVALADFNRDGKVDIVTANGSNSVSVLLGNGDGTFHIIQNFAAGSSPVGMAVGDFNRDGWPDVAVVNSQVAGAVSVLLNTRDWRTLAASFPASITAGVAGNLAITAQNPDGTTATNYTGTVHFTSSDPQAVLPADYTFTAADAGVHTFNIKLKTAGAQSITVTIPGTAFLGAEVESIVNPALASRLSLAAPSDVSANYAFSATITALDPYGNVDTDYTGTVQFTSTDPSAVLPTFYTFTTGSGGDNGIHTIVNGFTLHNSGSQTITATDKATSGITGSAAVTAVTPFHTPVSYPVGNRPSAVAVGDFANNGTLDLVVANHDSGNVSVLLGKADGTFQPAHNYVVGGTPVSVAVGDFNKDGKLDIVTANDSNGSVSVLLGKGDGSFLPALNYILPSNAGLAQTLFSLAVGDFNKDGKLDVAVTANTYTPGTCNPNNGYCYPGAYAGNINVLIGNGAGGFSTDNIQPFTDPDPLSIAVGDINGDGNLDLAVTESQQNYVSVLLGNGNGTFGNPTSFYTGITPYAVAVGDFNGDGKLDLVSANQGSDTVSVLMGNGNDTFVTAANYKTGSTPQAVALADFNRDGKLDIVTTNDNAAGSVSVLLGNGNGTFGSALNYASGGSNPQSVAAGDINRDGWPDLVVSNTSSNTVSVLLNPADGSVGEASRLAVSGFSTPVTAGTSANFSVTATNADGITATNYTGTVHFTSTDFQAVLPADYTFTAADGGVHTFSATLKTAGTQSITAIDSTTFIGGTDAGIAVNPAAASTLSVTGFPSPITAGVAGSFTITARDAFGNIADGYSGTVHFISSDGKAALPTSYTFAPADAGRHTFAASLKTAGTQSITAADTTTSSITGTDAGITVNPSGASILIISAPSSVPSGVQFSLSVSVEDAYGNVVTDYASTIHFTSTDSQARLPKDYSFTASDRGVHTLTGLVLRKKGNQKITVTDTRDNVLLASVIVDVL